MCIYFVSADKQCPRHSISSSHRDQSFLSQSEYNHTLSKCSRKEARKRSQVQRRSRDTRGVEELQTRSEGERRHVECSQSGIRLDDAIEGDGVYGR